MTFLVALPLDNDSRPDWFTEKFRALSDDIIFDRMHDGKPWTWHWNAKYENKVRIRDGKILLEFENEQEYTWFILKEL